MKYIAIFLSLPKFLAVKCYEAVFILAENRKIAKESGGILAENYCG
jgi:hypothetical protein